jgi:hypothetical protein
VISGCNHSIIELNGHWKMLLLIKNIIYKEIISAN